LDLITIQGNLTGDQYIRDFLQPQLDVGCPVVIAGVILDAMLLPTDECVAHEVPEPEYDGLACPKYALCDLNPGSWLAKEQKSRLPSSKHVRVTPGTEL
jgi:hypothetical protein